jgi:hypothetical protein
MHDYDEPSRRALGAVARISRRSLLLIRSMWYKVLEAVIQWATDEALSHKLTCVTPTSVSIFIYFEIRSLYQRSHGGNGSSTS